MGVTNASRNCCILINQNLVKAKSSWPLTSRGCMQGRSNLQLEMYVWYKSWIIVVKCRFCISAQIQSSETHCSSSKKNMIDTHILMCRSNLVIIIFPKFLDSHFHLHVDKLLIGFTKCLVYQ